MGLFDFLKHKEDKKQESSMQFPYMVQGNGKFIHISSPKLIRRENGRDLYTCLINETIHEDDAILLDSGKPISFEIPEGRPDLAGSLLQAWDLNRSGRQLGEVGYTFIGDLKYGEDGRLYYYNEPPTKEAKDCIDREDQIYRKEKMARDQYREDLIRENQKNRQEAAFRESLRIDKIQEENKSYQEKISKERLQDPYFKQTNLPSGRLSFDLINLEDAHIILIRDIKKFKDADGRYLYKAKMRETWEDSYTEYTPDILGNDVVFTVPGRLEDIIQGSDQRSVQIKGAMQGLLSRKACEMKDRSIRDCIDLGGVAENGAVIENTEAFGVSRGLVDRINSFGAKTMEEINMDNIER